MCRCVSNWCVIGLPSEAQLLATTQLQVQRGLKHSEFKDKFMIKYVKQGKESYLQHIAKAEREEIYSFHVLRHNHLSES